MYYTINMDTPVNQELPSKKVDNALSLTIKDKAVLYTAYMPFIIGGGLFIPTTRSFPLGTKLSINISLIAEPEKILVQGVVKWITPKGAHDNRAPGIGIQFEGDASKLVRNKIEAYLGGMLKSSNPTHTI